MGAAALGTPHERARREPPGDSAQVVAAALLQVFARRRVSLGSDNRVSRDGDAAHHPARVSQGAPSLRPPRPPPSVPAGPRTVPHPAALVSLTPSPRDPDDRPLPLHARSALDAFDDEPDDAEAHDEHADGDSDADGDVDTDDVDDDARDPNDLGDDDALDDDFPLGDGVADRAAVVHCPSCGEPSEVAVDPGGGAHQEYVEDCPVCCRPWRVIVAYQPDGSADVWAQTDDE